MKLNKSTIKYLEKIINMQKAFGGAWFFASSPIYKATLNNLVVKAVSSLVAKKASSGVVAKISGIANLGVSTIIYLVIDGVISNYSKNKMIKKINEDLEELAKEISKEVIKSLEGYVI